jgi:hypothetical protein
MGVSTAYADQKNIILLNLAIGLDAVAGYNSPQ